MTSKTVVTLPFTIAKVRAMRSFAYEGDRLAALGRARSVPELAKLLGFDQEAAPGPLELEARLTTRHISDLLRVDRLVAGTQGRLFDWLLARYQMENLKVILRFWSAGEPLERLARYLVEVPGLKTLPVEDLAEVRDLTNFIRLVPQRVFARGLKEGLAYWQAEGRTFLAEAGLDAAYFRELSACQSALTGTDQLTTRQLVGADVDTYNLLLVTRAQLNYHLELDEVAKFVVAGTLISRSALLGARGETLSDILSALRAVEVLHLGETMPETIADLEDALALRLYRMANRRYYQSMLDLGALVAFFYLKRNELANLIRVVEGRRYELDWPEVERRLVPPRDGGAR